MTIYMLQIYQKKLKFTVDVRSLPACTIDGRTVRVMALSGPRAWTDREPFAFVDAVSHDEQFEMKEVNSFWPNFFVGINGGNWMVLDGIIKSESQVDAPIVRYGRLTAGATALQAWCTGGEGAPIHPDPYRTEVLTIFASAGVLSFDGVIRVFNRSADESIYFDDTIDATVGHRIVANIKSEGDVYDVSVETPKRAAGELVGQLTIATVLEQDKPMFSGLVKTGNGAMVATALGRTYTWATTLTSWTIAPYYDGGVVHVRTAEFLDVAVPGQQSGGGGQTPDYTPIVDAVDGVAEAIAGPATPTANPVVSVSIAVNVDPDHGAVDGAYDIVRSSLSEDDPGEKADNQFSDGFTATCFYGVELPDAPIIVQWCISEAEAQWGIALIPLGGSVDIGRAGSNTMRVSAMTQTHHGEPELVVELELISD